MRLEARMRMRGGSQDVDEARIHYVDEGGSQDVGEGKKPGCG
jgi:hypothetical protein